MIEIDFEHKILVLGGAASGKSRYAERLIEAYCHKTDEIAEYLATLPRDLAAADTEMETKVLKHRARRDQGLWHLTEEPLDIYPHILRKTSEPLLVDCLTLWLNNLLAAGRNPWDEFLRLEDSLWHSIRRVVLVSNELGLGLVPAEAESRQFRELQGELNQIAAEYCDRVVLVVAGQPLVVR
ncbi:MAG: bifunctional adenosylcobinamide kinase/adenosylcobinamide-phosphate guanylyltransferase [Alphaproteobacteria bacterium]|nr:bifunctional adenosylcobinamide kinase/adenosylcobinamide-phosphate guanylyltransferase [Alphaproteobacteria bacterium]